MVSLLYIKVGCHKEVMSVRGLGRLKADQRPGLHGQVRNTVRIGQRLSHAHPDRAAQCTMRTRMYHVGLQQC